MKTLHFALGILFCLFTFSLDTFAYSGGSGTAAEPYQINTYDDFIMLVETSADWNKSFVLTANIDLSADDWTEAVIAWDTDSSISGFQGTPFSGSFNGNNHILSGLKINNGKDFLGLFGKLSYAIISNLTIQNAQVAGIADSIQIGDFACPDGSNTDDLQRLSEDWLLSYSTDLYGADATGDKSVNLYDFTMMAQLWLEGI